MIMNTELKSLLEAETVSLTAVKEHLDDQTNGSSMMLNDAMQLVAHGITSIDEVERVVLRME